MIIYAYCTCKDPEPEEVRKGFITCKKCHNDINPTDFYDDSACEDLVQDDQAQYESRREEDITFDHNYR